MQTVYETDQIWYSHSVSEGYDMEAMHIHDVYEIYMTQSNDIKFWVNDRFYELECGDVMLFSDTDLHKVGVPQKGRYERYILTFPPHLLPETVRSELLACFGGANGLQSHKVQLTMEEQRTFIAMLQTLGEEQQQNELSELGQILALCRILVFINRVCREKMQPAPVPVCVRDPRIRTVLEYVNVNYNQQITLDELAGQCYLNKYYLCRLFRKETGFCIQDYITYRRLSAAIALLRKGESVSDTAQLSGFNSDTFFITTFKKQFGMTPYRYASHNIRPQV